MTRTFPVIFSALAEGRVHLSGLVMLKPHLNRSSVAELLAAVEHKSSREDSCDLRRRAGEAGAPRTEAILASAYDESGDAPRP